MAFEIVHIPHDDESVRSYVERFKAFRLLSLKIAPEAFGSTYAREITFTDDIWLDRLASPKANAFIALQSDQIISLLVAIERGPEEISTSRDPRTLGDKVTTDPAQLHWVFNGMFTLPEARGQGIAQALIERVIKYGFDEAARIGKTFAASILVDEDNPAARGLYAKCGFVPFKEEPLDGESPRVVIFLKYVPESRGAQGSA